MYIITFAFTGVYKASQWNTAAGLFVIGNLGKEVPLLVSRAKTTDITKLSTSRQPSCGLNILLLSVICPR